MNLKTKKDCLDFIEGVALIKGVTNKDTKAICEKADLFLEDYFIDEKGTTLKELKDNVKELEELIQNSGDSDFINKIEELKKEFKKEVKKLTKKEDKKEEGDKKEDKKEDGIFKDKIALLSKNFKRVDVSNDLLLESYYSKNELYILSQWDSEFDAEDYDGLNITEGKIHLLDNNIDLLQVVFLGDKTLIAVSILNEVSTTLLKEDIKDKKYLENMALAFYIVEE